MQRFFGTAGQYVEPESIQVVPVEVIDAGDRVIVRALLQARACKSGASFDAPLVEVIRVEDAKVREVLIYSDTAAIVEAVA
jgi:ketosteroid isomerase-like protein